MINTEKLVKLFEIFVNHVVKGENANAETLGLLMEELYDGAVKEYRPLLAAIPNLTDNIAGDAGPLFAVFVKLINDIAENQELETEISRMRTIRARNRFNALTAYRNAGFKAGDAMALVLVDATKGTGADQAPRLLAKAMGTTATKSQE